MIRLSIRHNSRYIIEFDRVRFGGKQGLGGFVITIGLEGSRIPSEKPITITDISLSLSTEGGAMPIVLNVPSSIRVISCHEYAGKENVFFEALLTKDQVLAIEEYRKSEDLSIRIDLRALIICDDGISSSFEVSGHSVPKQEWLNALKSARFQDSVLLEIPIPEVSGNIRQAVTKSQEFIDQGHYNEAVGQCRKIIEALEAIRGDADAAKQASKKLLGKGDRESMTVIERMLAMREQVKNISHLGMHGDEPFTRSQARAVLSATLSLLAEPTVGFICPELAVSAGGVPANG